MEFYLVYIKEASPKGGWQSGYNETDGVVYDPPKTLQDRANIADECIKDLKIPFPCLLDGMDNRFQRAYSCWPSRAIVVGKDGKVVYASASGHLVIDATEISKAVKSLLP